MKAKDNTTISNGEYHTIREKYKRLNLGCGLTPINGYINVDNELTSKANILWDLNIYPYPFESNSIDEVYSSHTIEHLKEPFKFICEIWRICKNGAVVTLKFPHFTLVFNNLSHISGIPSCIFNTKYDYMFRYTVVKFKTEYIKYKWRAHDNNKAFNSLFHFSYHLLNIIVNIILNINVRLTEEFLCFLFCGINEVETKSIVIK